MEIYQGTSHCGLVIMYDFGDGKGYRLAAFQSTSVANIATEAKTITTAVFMDDSNAGPNITALDEMDIGMRLVIRITRRVQMHLCLIRTTNGICISDFT